MKKKIFSRQEQIAFLASEIGDKLEILRAENKISEDEVAVLNDIVNYAQSIVLYFKTTSEDTIPQVFNLLISANNYLKVEERKERVVLLNILKNKYQILSNAHSNVLETKSITM